MQEGRREFLNGCVTFAAGTLVANFASGAETQALQSEFLFDLFFDKGPVNAIDAAGAKRVVVSVAGGSFEGPRLKGTIVPPGGDWMIARSDGSAVVDLRLLLQTDDAQKIYMNCRGVAYTQPGGALYARILPMFETGAVKYAWMNNIVAAGVYRPAAGRIGYRVYQIL